MVKVAGLAILAILGLVSGQASAVPISYSITGNGFYDNPVGSFTFDSDNNTYSNVSIFSLDYYGSASGNATSLRSRGLLGWTLSLTFADLPTAGGSVAFSGTENARTFFGRVISVNRSGTINVPEPGAVFLLGAGLLGLGLVRRRSAAKS